MAFEIVSVAPALCMQSAILEIGGYDGAQFPVLDYILFCDLIRRGRAYRLPRTLSYYRITDSVTFKSDTFERQVRGSLRIKEALRREVPSVLGGVYYLESARRQFLRVREIGKDPRALVQNRLDRAAAWLSGHPHIGASFGHFAKAVRGTTQAVSGLLVRPREERPG